MMRAAVLMLFAAGCAAEPASPGAEPGLDMHLLGLCEPGDYVVRASLLNVRSEPRIGHNIVGQVAWGTALVVTGGGDSADGWMWCRIERGDGEAWVAAQLIERAELVAPPVAAGLCGAGHHTVLVAALDVETTTPWTDPLPFGATVLVEGPELRGGRTVCRIRGPEGEIGFVDATLLGRCTGGAVDALGRRIEVNLWAQALYVCRDEEIVFARAVSTGTPRYQTCTGLFQIKPWRPVEQLMISPFPDDYYEVWSTHVQYFNRAMAIHGTTSHRAFGRPMSHGCVNMDPEDARAVYDEHSAAGTWVRVYGVTPGVDPRFHCDG
jgi:hypothetical protein